MRKTMQFCSQSWDNPFFSEKSSGIWLKVCPFFWQTPMAFHRIFFTHGMTIPTDQLFVDLLVCRIFGPWSMWMKTSSGKGGTPIPKHHRTDKENFKRCLHESPKFGWSNAIVSSRFSKKTSTHWVNFQGWAWRSKASATRLWGHQHGVAMGCSRHSGGGWWFHFFCYVWLTIIYLILLNLVHTFLDGWLKWLNHQPVLLVQALLS